MFFPFGSPGTADGGTVGGRADPAHIVELLLQHPVDTLVLQVGVSGGGQQGFLSGQGSVGEQIVYIPASGLGVSGSVLGFLPEQCSTAPYSCEERISERTVEQTVAGGDFSSRAPRRGGPRGGLHGFPPVQGSAVDFSVPFGDADEGVFRTFPLVKKSAKVGAPSRSELAAHSSSHGVVSSLEEAVQEEMKEEHQVSPMPDSIEWVQLSDDKGRNNTGRDALARRGGNRRGASESSGSARRVLEGVLYYWHKCQYI